MYFPKIRVYLSLVLILSVNLSCATEPRVIFKGIDAPDGFTSPVSLKGYLYKPKGDGPFPAIVMLHHCSGLNKEGFFTWAKTLRDAGYVALLVDSLGPRGIGNVCEDNKMHFKVRACDAHAAKLYLSKQNFVNPEKIAVMGWSHGACGAIYAVQDQYRVFPGSPFSATVAYYPYCTSLIDLVSPLLILIGENDDWTPARRCEDLIPSDSPHEISIKVYPKTHHGFFFRVYQSSYFGHRISYNASATRDAKQKTIDFLNKYLK